MVRVEVCYICDCCGRKMTKPVMEDPVPGLTALYSDPNLPDGWAQMIEPFRLCCDHCMNAFMNVYDSLRR